MRRTVLVVLLATALASIVAVWNAGAQARSAHGFQTTWCDNPVVVPLAESVGGAVVPAAGVVTARGTETALTTRGPGIRMNERGSRVQVTFDETLFHTQWLFESVDTGDSLRVDATIGSARQQIQASSVRGSFTAGEAVGASSLTAIARSDTAFGSGEIDVFVGATEFLFTSEADSPIELVSAIGCPALSFATQTVDAARWDPDSQQFFAEYEVEFSNALVNARSTALQVQEPDAATNIVDDISIDLSLAARGFASASIEELELSSGLERRQNESFDGVNNAALLSTPLQLTDQRTERIRVLVAYVPDFDDPAWSEGIPAPAPTIRLRGRVDDIAVGTSGSLAAEGNEIRGETLPAPEAELRVVHEPLSDAVSATDGSVSFIDRIRVINEGETAISDLLVNYSIAELFGENTLVQEVSGGASGGCSGRFVDSFDGSGRTLVVFDQNGLDVGAECSITVRARVLPGNIPTTGGTDYEGAVTASARSGARELLDAEAVRVTVAQHNEAEFELSEITSTNLRDGRYRFSGTLTIQNTGDQDLREGAARIDVIQGVGNAAEAVDVVFEEFTGPAECGILGTPQSFSGATLIAGLTLAPNAECSADFSLITRPGARLSDWRIVGNGSALTPRGIALDIDEVDSEFALTEAPNIRAAVGVVGITNNANGNYTLLLDTTVRNTGNTPLIAAGASTNAENVFGASLISAERTVDTCSAVGFGNSLAVGIPSEECVVRERLVVRPGAQLGGWEVEAEATGTSTSTRIVRDPATSAEISFEESPSINSTLTLLGVDKVDDESFRYRLTGEVTNRGDIELRDVSAQLPISELFGDAGVSIEGIGAEGLTISERFDGIDSTELFSTDDVLPVGVTARWDLVVVVTTGSNAGPFDLSYTVEGTSPATETVSDESGRVSQAHPLIGITDRFLEPTNNNDGTYSVVHTVTAINAGAEPVSAINIFTDLDPLFDGLIIGDVTRRSSCDRSVAAGSSCTLTQSATLRPGSRVGPYLIDVSISGSDASGLRAGVINEPNSSDYRDRAFQTVTFEESLSVEVQATVDNIENLGDGTYRAQYSFDVTNTSDVPLYQIDSADPLLETFGETLVANNLVSDSCLGIAFSSPLAPSGVCTRVQEVVVRPLDVLGPWEVEYEIVGGSPSFATITASADADPVTFEETVEIEAESTLVVSSNLGEGTYVVTHTASVTNTSNVPLVSVALDDRNSSYGQRRTERVTDFDSCGFVSSRSPLLPGESCRVENIDRVVPVDALGPYELTTDITGASPSGAIAPIEITTVPITFTEDPDLSTTSQITSVEAVEAGSFRVVTTLDIANPGDVRISQLDLSLDLDAVFPDSVYRIDGVISDDFAVEEAFAARESSSLLAPGQSIGVGGEGRIILVLSIEPRGESGPFLGELRASGVSPARAETASVIDAQFDLPSVGVEIVTQSVDNNRDGSYTVTTSYAVENDGSTPLEFLRLTEDLETVFAGTSARVVSIESDDLEPAPLEDRSRGADLLAWGVGLDAGERAVVTSTVLVTPGNVLGPFEPEVRSAGQSPAGTPVFNEYFGTNSIEFIEQPALRVEQRLLQRPEWNTTGRFDVSFAIDVINDGDVELRGLQVREDLLAALGSGSRIIVNDVRSETLVVNSNFDGLGRPPSEVVDVDPVGDEEAPAPRVVRDIGDTRLLGGLGTLAAGETGTIELDLTIVPETRGVYSTRVSVAARTPAGTGIGSDGDVIEANTLTRLSVQGEIGVAKRTIGDAVVRADGSVGVTYEILVENVGPFPLTNVEVHDQLSQAFGVGSTFVTSRVRIDSGSPCDGFASASYDGGTIDPVLVAGVVLQPGESCRVQYDAAVIPSNDLPGPFRSSAFAIASDPFSGTVIDDSTDGTDPDPNRNQEPGDDDIATSVTVEAPAPQIEVEVEPLLSEVVEEEGDWHEFGYRLVIENTGLIDVDTTRLIASLDDAWDVPYEVVEIRSGDLVVNEGFDGDRDTNLLNRRNRVRAGATVELVVVLQSEVPGDGDPLDLDLVFRGQSLTGDEIEVAAPTVSVEPAQAFLTSRPWFETLTTEERRLTILGIGAFVLFFAIFTFSAVRRFRRDLAARRLKRQPVDDTPPVTTQTHAEDELTIDLRDEESIDLRNRAHSVDRRSETTGEDEHHRPRRRRGRRRARQ